MPSLFEPAEPAGWALVAVERGVDRWPEGLTYSVPPHLADLRPGERVVVPLGRGDRITPGWVIRRQMKTDVAGLAAGRVKSIERRDEGGVALPGEVLQLALWISSYYCCPVGLALAGILPAAVRKGVGRSTRLMVDLAEAEAEAAPETAGRRMGPKRRAVLEYLRSRPAEERPMELHALARAAGLAGAAPVRALVKMGLLTAERRSQVEAAWLAEAVEPPPVPTPTPDQQAVVDQVAASLGGGFSRHLLHGVTGSGKTEVYLRLMEQVVARGQRALLLVPEISLTPQTGARVIGRFPGVRVAILHSGLTAAQRHQQWAMVASGEARLILGARSAVFAPVPDGSLGLIVVDEEHDGSYKQDQQPRYHGRDVALRRGQLAGCPVLLASATPSLESWHNVRQGHYRLHELRHRAPGLTLPRVVVVDFAEERKRFPDRRVRLVGPTLDAAIRATLEDRGQVLLLLNRRGYGNYVACADHRCGWIMECPHCDAGMICHQMPGPERERFVRCHHCLEESRLPRRCPTCGKAVTVFGLGTQRVEEELRALHPTLAAPEALLRLDGDTMRTATDFHRALGRFGRGEVRMLVGTQMIAKGLDFPGVRLVGVVNADTALNLPDFRASERTFQLVSQVCGRCGRGQAAGSAVVQTFQPQAPPIVLAARGDYRAFAEGELALRERFGLPPLRRMARLVVRHESAQTARAEAELLAERLRAIAPAGVDVRPPAPCPLERISDRWRMQVEVLAEKAAPLQKLLADARTSGVVRPGEALAVDVDPISLM